MKSIVPYIVQFQQTIDIENYTFLGFGADRWVHCALLFLIIVLSHVFKKLRWGLIVAITLIFLKEILDLSMIYIFEPPKWAQWLDVIIDIAAGFLGLILGLLFIRFFNRRSSAALTPNQLD